MTGSESQATPTSTGFLLQRTGLTVHVLDGEALIFDPISADTHRLNETALFIWRQCDGATSAQQIARCVSDVYDVAPQAALKHAENTLADLARLGVLSVGSAGRV